MEVVLVISLIIGAYLLGSIPSAVWIGKWFFKVDVREHGSGNAGATNVLRVLGRKAALPVFLIDAAKGYAAVMLSWLSSLEPESVFAPYSEWFVNLRIILMVAAILGHIFPIFAGFRGGKGVATIAGCMVALAPIPLACSFVVFIVILAAWHYVSLGSIMGAITFPIWMVLKFIIFDEPISPTMVIFSFVVAGVLVFMHRKNIARLREHTESKTYIIKRK